MAYLPRQSTITFLAQSPRVSAPVRNTIEYQIISGLLVEFPIENIHFFKTSRNKKGLRHQRLSNWADSSYEVARLYRIEANTWWKLITSRAAGFYVRFGSDYCYFFKLIKSVCAINRWTVDAMSTKPT